MNTQAIDRAAANKARQQSLVDTLQNRGQIDRVAEFIQADIVDHSACRACRPGSKG